MKDAVYLSVSFVNHIEFYDILDTETNIPKSGVIKKILPIIAPSPKMIPIRVAISIPNPLSYWLI